MPIHFRCPHCDKLLAIGTAKGGTQIQCPLCARLITVPPRTEVQLPTTTVLPPEVAQSWWTDAPPVVPPKALADNTLSGGRQPPESRESQGADAPRSEPTPPEQPADVWWLTAQTPSVPPETALTTTPAPSVPPPLPPSFLAASTEAPDLLVFEPPGKTPTLDPIAPTTPTRSFTPLRISLLIGIVMVSLLALLVVFVLLRGSEPTPTTSATKPANPEKEAENPPPQKEDAGAKPALPAASSSSQPPHERTEEELRQEAAVFAEITFAKGGEYPKASEDNSPNADPQWLTERPDLAGLPIRAAKERVLDAATAGQLQAGALALRAHLFAAAQGGDKRPDAQKLRAALTVNGEQSNKWLRPEAVAALQQLLMAEDAAVRQVLVDQLARIDGPRAGAMLARNALFDLSPEVRKSARAALAKRPHEEYQQVLLDGFRYPWSAVVDHAAEALVALKRRETVPALVKLLDRASPASPYPKPGTEGLYVHEVVRINHPRGCLLCHAPSSQETEKSRGFMPSLDQPLPPPFTREYYANRRPGRFVRADVTYLQQDFSVPLPVEKRGKWPAVQRFDFLVLERRASDGEVQAARRAEGKSPSTYQQAIFFALRELTGADPGSTVESWKHWTKQSAR